jgi:hypothetical protein
MVASSETVRMVGDDAAALGGHLGGGGGIYAPVGFQNPVMACDQRFRAAGT